MLKKPMPEISDNYRFWFDIIDIDLNEDFDIVYALYQAVLSKGNSVFKPAEYVNIIRVFDDGIIVKLPTKSHWLLFLTDKSADSFLSYIDTMFDGGVVGEWAIREALKNENQD